MGTSMTLQAHQKKVQVRITIDTLVNIQIVDKHFYHLQKHSYRGSIYSADSTG